MKILAFTSIRSDYDIMSPLYKLLQVDREIDFQILVSGAHLSNRHNQSVHQIEKDGFKILAKIETLFDGDTTVSRLKSASILLLQAIEIVDNFSPDLLIYAGDREDVIMYALISAFLDIPSIHVYGGDHVGGEHYVDNPIRHATSKLSTIHFVSLHQHKQRLIAMGEHSDRIFEIGSIALDSFKNFQPIDKKCLFEMLSAPYHDQYAVLIFHPVTEELEYIEEITHNILKALELCSIFTFVGAPNSDPGSQVIQKVYEQYMKNPNFYFYKNCSQKIFLSMYKNASFLIGNSSSGITEAATIPIPAINVGIRQRGRFADKNVIFCDSHQLAIQNAIHQAMSSNFLKSIENMENSYGDGESAKRAYNIIKNNNFKKMLKKEDALDVISFQKNI